MTETTLTFTSGGHTLVGTLTTPDGSGRFAAVLLIPGSGPVDRDSNHKRIRLDLTRQLAVALHDAGVATFRYDKRGIGASTGDWLSAGFHDNADDAQAALEVLASRREVDPARVVVVGHSEGALLGTVVAARGARLAGVVLLSGSATPGEELLRWQVAQIAPTLPAPVRAVLRLLRLDLAKRVARNHVRIKATTADVVRMDGARVNARWHREFMAYDPRPDLARITAPVLAVTGSKDLQAKPGDLAAIAELVGGPVTVLEVPDVSHILRPRPGPASMAGYRKEVRGPVDPRVTAAVTDWVRERRTTVRR